MRSKRSLASLLHVWLGQLGGDTIYSTRGRRRRIYPGRDVDFRFGHDEIEVLPQAIQKRGIQELRKMVSCGERLENR